MKTCQKQINHVIIGVCIKRRIRVLVYLNILYSLLQRYHLKKQLNIKNISVFNLDSLEVIIYINIIIFPELFIYFYYLDLLNMR